MNPPLGDKPRVSIVTPSLNQGQFIRETIESVLAQDYSSIEYLVVDGGSTDDTLEVLRRYDGRVTWISEPDRNQANAINKGFARSTGSILTWLNSDDVLLPGAVTRVVDEFKSNIALGLVYGASRLIGSRGDEIGRALSLEPDLWAMLFLADHVPQPSAFFRRSALERVGKIDETLRYCMDYELFIRLFVDGAVRRIPDLLSESRIYDSTLSLSGGFRRFREIAGMVRRHSNATVPPAVANYAIDWAEHTVQRVIRRLGSGARVASALRLCENASAYGYRQVRRHSNPRWEDNWVGRDVRFLVRKAAGEYLEILGEVPPRSDESKQTLEVRADNVRLDRAVLPVGPFQLVYSLPPMPTDSAAGSAAVMRTRSIQVKAEWARVIEHSNDRGTSSDRRRLSWRADSVEAIRTLPAAQRPSSGWYGDGWASPILSVTVFDPGTSITVAGRIPHEIDKIHGQRLRAEIAGDLVYNEVLGIGEFALELPAPDARVTIVRLYAESWFDPHDDDPEEEPRRLAYLLDSVGDNQPPRSAIHNRRPEN